MMLVWRGPGMLGFRLPHPPGLPDARSDLANSIYALGSQAPSPEVLGIPDDERQHLMASLSTTFARSIYHARRFDLTLQAVVDRWRATGAATHDSCAAYVLFEVSALLSAARTVVDEVVYIAARRKGIPPGDASRWKATKVARCDLKSCPEYDVAEIRALQSYLVWYEELNAYRNILVHSGWNHNFGGYYPPESTDPESLSPILNIMLVPDLDSIGATRRAHGWRYTNKRRLESLVGSVEQGLTGFVQEAANIWGAQVKRGTLPDDKRPHVILGLPDPVYVVGRDIFIPIFSSAARAHQFANVHKVPRSGVDLHQLLPTTLEDGCGPPGFWLGLPAKEKLQQLISDAGTLPEGAAFSIVLDLGIGPDGGLERGTLIERLPFSGVHETSEAGVHLKLAADLAETLYMWRRTPDIP